MLASRLREAAAVGASQERLLDEDLLEAVRWRVVEANELYIDDGAVVDCKHTTEMVLLLIMSEDKT